MLAHDLQAQHFCIEQLRLLIVRANHGYMMYFVNSIKIEEYTAALSNKIDLDSVAGTYCGVLPPDVETTLTLNADGTYLLTRTFKEKQNEREKLRGVFQMLDGNVLMLVHPSSGDNIFYKVREDKSVVLLDSFGNEPKNEDRKNYTLRKK